jgi:hypothetical protein
MIKTTKIKFEKLIVGPQIRNLNITIMSSLLLISVFLGAMSYLYLQSSAAPVDGQISANAYRRALEESFRPETAQLEWKRLYSYHGNPAVVIYEEGKTPYFYNQQGSKCTFIYPSKEPEPINHTAEDSEYYAELTLNK